MKSGKIITGVLIGAAAGAILGILFAPDKGENTRGKIRKGGTDIKDKIKDKISKLVDGITDHYENAKEEAADLAEEAKQKAAAVKAEVKHSLS